MLPSNIDEVIAHLDKIILEALETESHLAFFAVLYRQVTVRVKEGIINGEFDDGPRMERLDVIFANRYLEAYYAYKAGEPITKSWRIALDAGSKSGFMIMQHLLSGINAHINLDLGIAAAETVGAHGDLDLLKNDFDNINHLLASMVEGVKSNMNKVSPLFGLLSLIGKGREDKLVSFSINIARKGAWQFAREYHSSLHRETSIQHRDEIIADLAHNIYHPKSRLLQFFVKLILWFEWKNVKKAVAVLDFEQG